MFALFSTFDKDKNNALDMRECLELVDAIFRTTFIVEASSPNVVKAAAPGTVKYVGGTSTLGNRQASPARVVQGGLGSGTIQGLATQPGMARTLGGSQVRVVSRDRINSPRGQNPTTIVQEEVIVGEGPRRRSASPLVMSASAPVGSGTMLGGQLQARRLNSATGTFSPGVPMPGLSPRSASQTREGSIGPSVRTQMGSFPRTASPMGGMLGLEGSVIIGGPSNPSSQAGSMVSGPYGQPFTTVPMLGSPNAIQARQPSMERLEVGGGGLRTGSPRSAFSPPGMAQPVVRSIGGMR